MALSRQKSMIFRQEGHPLYQKEGRKMKQIQVHLLRRREFPSRRQGLPVEE
jgi:hypothetical protein